MQVQQERELSDANSNINHKPFSVLCSGKIDNARTFLHARSLLRAFGLLNFREDMALHRWITKDGRGERPQAERSC